MRGLIVDYVGVLDGPEEEQQRWRHLLKSARDAGVGTAVLSNDPGGPGADHIRAWEQGGFVDAVILSGEIGAEKPTAEAFDTAAAALELPASDCVLVDDRIENIVGAIEHGMVGVLYSQFDRTVIEIMGLFELSGEF
ncbi:HAD-IA family hydrolase [Corynebacterium ulceribovis]|uniref:HAD-IA family hydrolase n=1 Tax=Corynebacterium ulceribovis TaxID=487732 RepID=UPI000475989B|nr:HAD-IA family hydrolase [Corynebacterium ulceribovis]